MIFFCASFQAFTGSESYLARTIVWTISFTDFFSAFYTENRSVKTSVSTNSVTTGSVLSIQTVVTGLAASTVSKTLDTGDSLCQWLEMLVNATLMTHQSCYLLETQSIGLPHSACNYQHLIKLCAHCRYVKTMVALILKLYTSLTVVFGAVTGFNSISRYKLHKHSILAL